VASTEFDFSRRTNPGYPLIGRLRAFLRSEGLNLQFYAGSKKVIVKTPMGRFGDITELNGIVQFLCSDAASVITGTIYSC